MVRKESLTRACEGKLRSPPQAWSLQSGPSRRVECEATVSSHANLNPGRNTAACLSLSSPTPSDAGTLQKMAPFPQSHTHLPGPREAKEKVTTVLEGLQIQQAAGQPPQV